MAQPVFDAASLEQVVSKTDFDFLGDRYEGKVRDSYVRGERRFLIATDRLSCFDSIISTIPYKGQVLTKLAEYWFRKTEAICPNHLIDVPHPNVMVVKECEVLPIEVVVRGYLTGSAWRSYEKGEAVSGVQLRDGYQEFDKLDRPILTPTTKGAVGDRDIPISESEILEQGLVKPEVWEQVSTVVQKLYQFASDLVAKQGLLFVDSKYELGLRNGELTLVDEIHTLDSSRFWDAASYQERRDAGLDPEMLDKEPARQWALDQGFSGEGEPPLLPDDERLRLSKHYVDAMRRITGIEFEVDVAPELLEERLHAYVGDAHE